ncbi:hypothetical protein CFT9_03944 [Pseudomonas sp. CFT9]|nr:hypothetical protein CFT9_03944 [Pseudomonas sp. CFT9]
MLTEQLRTLPGFLLPSLFKCFLGLLDVRKQGLLRTLGLTQGTLGPIGPVPAQAPQRLHLTEQYVRMGHGRSAP